MIHIFAEASVQELWRPNYSQYGLRWVIVAYWVNLPAAEQQRSGDRVISSLKAVNLQIRFRQPPILTKLETSILLE